MATQTQALWQDFAQTTWGQQPTVLKGKEFIIGEETFQVFIQGCEQFRAGELDEHAKLYINGERLPTDQLAAALPTPEDGTPERYEERLMRDYDARSFLIYAYDLQKYWPELTDRLEHFVGDLFDHVKCPGGPATVEIFMGRYKTTDGGIHKERCATFHGVLSGDKMMRVWPEDTWDPSQEETLFKGDETTGHDEVYLKKMSADSCLDKAIDLVGEPGDVMYWPAGWWHIGLSPRLTVSVTLALYHSS